MARSGASPVPAMAAATVLLATLLLHVVPPGGAQDAVPPSVTIKNISFAGSGCSRDNTAYSISADRSVLSLVFSYMNVSTETPEGKWKNCHVTMSLDFPEGWSFSILDVRARGYAFLEEGVKGTHKVKSHISGQAETARSSHTLHGPHDDTYEFTKPFDLEIWSVCNDPHSLNLDTSVEVSGPNGRLGYMTVDSQDAVIGLLFNFNIDWKQCA